MLRVVTSIICAQAIACSARHIARVASPDGGRAVDLGSPADAAVVDLAAPVGPHGLDPADWSLTFDDEFDRGLDANVWTDHLWYLTANATRNYAVGDGELQIWPQRDATGAFFDRHLDTDGRFYQTYGFFEISAKLCRGKGTWPAFWLYNHDDPGDIRPEIDIMEAYPGGDPWGADGTGGARIPVMFAPTIWLGPPGVEGGTTMLATPDLSAAFHTYGVEWDATRVTFYFDGDAYYSANASLSSRMYIILDVQFGSASGTPDSSTPEGPGNAFEIDYVRAWQRRPTA